MQLALYQIDAFTDRPFAGNPAAVVPLEYWLPDALLAAIAAENNLSETAFFVPEGEGFRLRWFTPGVEVDLCGHATLAAAWVLYERLGWEAPRIPFVCASGELGVRRLDDGRLELDFPARTLNAAGAALAERVAAALCRQPVEVLCSASNLLAVFADEAEVRAVAPDFAALRRLPLQGVIVTAPGEHADFVSRYFAPAACIDEDPVTGSAHCELTPYWVARLGRTRLHAQQVSKRHGELQVTLAGERVRIAGHAVPYLEGRITLAAI